MAFKFLPLIILFFVGCNAGVVPQHFISNHTEPDNVGIEKTSTGISKNESDNLHRTIKTEIMSTAVGNDDHHNSSKVSIGIHNISEELNHTKLNVSEGSHSIVSNHPKEFDHSHKSDTKGSGRSRKKSSKVSNRSKKTTSKDTKHVEKVTKGHSINELHHSEDHTRELSHPVKKVTDDHSLNDSHHSEDLTRELNHPVKKVTDGHSLNDSHHSENFMKEVSHNVENLTDGHSINDSHHLENFTRDLSHSIKDSNMPHHAEHHNEDHFKVSLNDHTDDMKESNRFDKNVSEAINHGENITKIDSNQKRINGSDHAVLDFNHFTLLNESHHQESVLNNSHVDAAKEFLEFDNVTHSVHQVEHNESRHFENVSETGNDTMMGFDTIKDIQMADHFESTSVKVDGTAENLSNSFKISDDLVDLKEHHVDNVSDINLHDPSKNSFHEDNIHKKDMETHSEKKASEMDPHIPHGSFNSTEEILKDTESLSSGTDSHHLSTKENSSLDSALLHKDSEVNSTLSNQFNETNSNDTHVFFTLSPIDTNSSSDLTHEFHDLEVSTNGSKLNPETNDHAATEQNATQSMFSGIGLDFLFNSELAKNAASAMGVFNFTDSALTDHIMDDKNDVHDFLDIIHPAIESDQSGSKENMPENLNETDPELNLIAEVVTTLDPQTLLNGTVDEETTTELSSILLNSTAIEETTTVLSSILLNSTVDFEETTMVSEPVLNSTVEFEETTTIVSHSGSNSTVIEVVCPPPGLCIFWFLAQDTCAVNSHCLGSRICCRIGCAKTCIEV